ncbi:MAG: glycosyltransferase [Candidatus Euphemobacter frigidus]|nr:glycosyltransferase [Candidatus Euphemobacter frigidus]MDP8276378.1 glycosyltransferase [Candidatus Euphemobacter frigidus]
MKIDLIIFPMHDWKKGEEESFRTRDGHLMKAFEKSARTGKILVINRPTSLPEMVLKKKSWKVKNVLSSRKIGFFSRLGKVATKTYVLDIFSPRILSPVFMGRDWWHFIFTRKSILSIAKRAMKELDMVSPILFLWTPMATPVIGQLGEKLIVFDAIDNWLLHPEIRDRREFIKKGYTTIKERADLIFVNSEPMKDFLTRNKDKPVLINNGVDKDFFQLDSSPLPEDMKAIKKPVVGYVGKMSKRLNIELISFLCRKLKHVSFVFIGQAINQKWIVPLFKLPNFYYLGDKPYSLLPFYLANFDIGIIPHYEDKYVIKGDSLKMYEYLAAGKPVVTSNITGAKKFQDVIQIASDSEKFLAGIKKYLQLIETKRLSPDRLREQLPENCSWKNKAELMIDLIFGALKKDENSNSGN